MEEPLPWLRQGDIFAEVPILVAEVVEGRYRPGLASGAALLITDNCQMDKRTNAGRPKATRLQFLPLHEIADLNHDSQRRLRDMEVNPPEPIYVGEIEDVGEAFGHLGEAYTIPATYFEVTSDSFEDHPQADPNDPHHLVANRHGDRVGTLDEAQLDLMHRKMVLFWLGAEAHT